MIRRKEQENIRFKFKAAREEVRKNRKIHKNEVTEDELDDDLAIDVKRAAFLKKRVDEEALMKEKSKAK